jgi:hypothetical protein
MSSKNFAKCFAKRKDQAFYARSFGGKTALPDIL